MQGRQKARTEEAAALRRLHRLAKTDRLRELREEAGWSQADLARALGVSPSQGSRWERGITRPRPAMAVRLLRLLEGED